MDGKVTRFVVGMHDGLFKIDAERCEMSEKHNRLTFYIGDLIVGAFNGAIMWAEESTMVAGEKPISTGEVEADKSGKARA